MAVRDSAEKKKYFEDIRKKMKMFGTSILWPPLRMTDSKFLALLFLMTFGLCASPVRGKDHHKTRHQGRTEKNYLQNLN